MNAKEFVLTAADPARAMLTVVARRCGYRAADLTGPSRRADLVAVRRALALELSGRGWSLAAIGEVLGGRHNASILRLLRGTGYGDPMELAHYRAHIRPVVGLLPPGVGLRGFPESPSRRRLRRGKPCEACGGGTSRGARLCRGCYVAARRREAVTTAPAPEQRVFKDILAQVAYRHGLTVADLCGPCRKARMVDARIEAVVALRRGLSLAEIGKLLGGRHHTTILHLEELAELRRKAS